MVAQTDGVCSRKHWRAQRPPETGGLQVLSASHLITEAGSKCFEEQLSSEPRMGIREPQGKRLLGTELSEWNAQKSFRALRFRSLLPGGYP